MELIVILLILLFIGGVGSGPYFSYSRGWGYFPSGIIWVIFVIVLIFWLLRQV